MSQTTKPRQLLKILIGAAWIDGIMQSEERDYLKQLAEAYHLKTDGEIAPLLSGLKPVSAAECYAWVSDYLGDYPSDQDYSDLLEAMAGLLYSDGTIETQEAQLLASLQDSDPHQSTPKSSMDKFLAKVQRLYRRALQSAS